MAHQGKRAVDEEGGPNTPVRRDDARGEASQRGASAHTDQSSVSVERAIRAASGEVRIHSLVGKGTVVEVWLPASMPG